METTSKDILRQRAAKRQQRLLNSGTERLLSLQQGTVSETLRPSVNPVNGLSGYLYSQNDKNETSIHTYEADSSDEMTFIPSHSLQTKANDCARSRLFCMSILLGWILPMLECLVDKVKHLPVVVPTALWILRRSGTLTVICLVLIQLTSSQKPSQTEKNVPATSTGGQMHLPVAQRTKSNHNTEGEKKIEAESFSALNALFDSANRIMTRFGRVMYWVGSTYNVIQAFCAFLLVFCAFQALFSILVHMNTL